MTAACSGAKIAAFMQKEFEKVRKAFDYSGLSMDEIIRHLARFISSLWQIHVFGEGNTRTTAVFFIKYLQSLGFNVTNDIFAKNAWYFRNAMVRANYNNLKNDIHETTEFLELFLKNLLLDENDPLQNRTMHVSGTLKQDSESVKQDFSGVKQDLDVLTKAGIPIRSANNIVKLIQHFGYAALFGRMDIAEELGITKSPASEILNKLLSVGAIVPVIGFGKGKYKFDPQFFK